MEEWKKELIKKMTKKQKKWCLEIIENIIYYVEDWDYTQVSFLVNVLKDYLVEIDCDDLQINNNIKYVETNDFFKKIKEYKNELLKGIK